MIIIFCTAILLGFLFQKDSLVKLYQFAVGMVAFGYGTQNPDNFTYMMSYYAYDYVDANEYREYLSNVEVSYRALNIIVKKLGVSYEVFRCIVYAIGILLFLLAIKNFTDRCNLVLSLYFIFPFIMDIIQIRFFLCGMVVIYASKYILIEEKKSAARYIISCVIASSFHSAGMVFAIFVILLFKGKIYARIYKISLVFSWGICALLLYGTKVSGLLNNGYFSTRTSIRTFVMFFTINLVLYTVAARTEKMLRRKNSSRLGYTVEVSIKNIVQILFLFQPLFLFSTEMFRFARVGILVLICVLLMDLRRNTYRYIYTISALTFILCLCLFFFSNYEKKYPLLRTCLENNTFISNQ